MIFRSYKVDLYTDKYSTCLEIQNIWYLQYCSHVLQQTHWKCIQFPCMRIVYALSVCIITCMQYKSCMWVSKGLYLDFFSVIHYACTLWHEWDCCGNLCKNLYLNSCYANNGKLIQTSFTSRTILQWISENGFGLMQHQKC